MRFEQVLKNIHQKWKYYREEKQDFEKFLIFLFILFLFYINSFLIFQQNHSHKTQKDFVFLMTVAKLNKIKLSEEFMVMWRQEQTIWDVMFPLYLDSEKEKTLKRVWDKFQIFQTDILEYSSVSKVKFFFSLPWRLLNFIYVFKLALKLHWLAGTQCCYSCRKRLITLQWCCMFTG